MIVPMPDGTLAVVSSLKNVVILRCGLAFTVDRTAAFLMPALMQQMSLSTKVTRLQKPCFRNEHLASFSVSFFS